MDSLESENPLMSFDLLPLRYMRRDTIIFLGTIIQQNVIRCKVQHRDRWEIALRSYDWSQFMLSMSERLFDKQQYTKSIILKSASVREVLLVRRLERTNRPFKLNRNWFEEILCGSFFFIADWTLRHGILCVQLF